MAKSLEDCEFARFAERHKIQQVSKCQLEKKIQYRHRHYELYFVRQVMSLHRRP